MSYLRECYDLHPELTERKYGRRQDLSEIERSFEPIQETQCLTYDHIEILMTKGSLDVNMFGYWPARKEIESDLEKREFDFHNLPGAEEQVIRDLQSTFRQIQLVSVILRFVDKTNYGILSPPVEQILGIGPTRYHRQKYLLYVKNLQRIRNETDGLSAAAHVDMALWVLSVGVLNGELDDEPRVDRLRKQYDNDPLLRELRVENLTSQLFQTLDRRQLAEALNRCSALPANELAGQIAGIEFEKSIKGALRISPTVHENLWPLVRRVRRVCLQEGLDRSRQKRWEEAVDIRNALIHPTGSWSTDDIGRLVEAMAEANQLLPRRTLPVRR